MPVVSRITQLPSFLSRSKSVINPRIPSHPFFTLDSSGVAGFFGGDGAVCAMGTVHLLPFRWLGGWYNSPGSYEIAKQYGQIANSCFWDGLFPGSKCEPAELFGLDGKVGPRRFLGAHSGTRLPTGHAAYLLSRMVEDMPDSVGIEKVAVEAVASNPVRVTVIHLREFPADHQVEIFLDATRNTVKTSALRYSGFLAIIPIAASIVACVVCALIGDWYCFACIALGIVAGGVACLIIGSGQLVFHHPKSTQYAPAGDGVMWEGTEIIVLLGSENAVNVFTRGSFSLRFDGGLNHGRIGWCSVLLTLQFLAQLLVIPQGQLFGQVMFVASLAVSWFYNMFVSSFDKETLQMDLLLHHLMPEPELEPGKQRDPQVRTTPQVQTTPIEKIDRFELPSWRTAVVLSLLVLQTKRPIPDSRMVLDKLLPNDTPVWRAWKKKVIEWVRADVEFNIDHNISTEFTGDEQRLYNQV